MALYYSIVSPQLEESLYIFLFSLLFCLPQAHLNINGQTQPPQSLQPNIAIPFVFVQSIKFNAISFIRKNNQIHINDFQLLIDINLQNIVSICNNTQIVLNYLFSFLLFTQLLNGLSSCPSLLVSLTYTICISITPLRSRDPSRLPQ